ncbi:MAG TPA: heme-copper oxidase subunit III [Flavitalea sp.]|nr:heme-copper oxidase subunit III [Flavitalea sp.]
MTTAEIVNTQHNKIHPHKFTLWVAIGSIIMMFAGLTSAFIVKGAQPEWETIEMPRPFYYSTLIILISSVTIQMALKAFKERRMSAYRRLITITAIAGMGFVGFQIAGFCQLWQTGTTFNGSGAGQFLYIIFGLHALHVLGGIVALLVMFFKAFSSRIRNYNPVSIELASIYWHFVDFLWIYLFIFFLWSI